MKFNNSKILAITFAAFALIVAALIIIPFSKSSENTHQPFETVNPEFANYIGAFTSGYISGGAHIRIRLNTDLQNPVVINQAVTEEYFSFDPQIKGHAEWIDTHTIEFIPDEPMPSKQRFNATFFLGKLINVKNELKEFNFQFEIIQQALQLETGSLRSYHASDFAYYSLTGTLTSADYAEAGVAEKCLAANIKNTKQIIRWQHLNSGTSHVFTIDSIKRGDEATELSVIGHGDPLGVDYGEQINFRVPAKNAFELLDVKVIPDAEPYVSVNFSNPLEQAQAMEGLVFIDGLNESKYIIQLNQVLIYPENTNSGTYTLKVTEGLKDARARALGLGSEHSIVFRQLDPAIRFVGDGNILPSSSGMKLAFETVNLKAIDLRVFKVYENNVLQFLQTNDLHGQSQLAQVGKIVLKKKINLGLQTQADMVSWKRSALDLSTLFKAEPGAIYRITITARKEYAGCNCPVENADAEKGLEVLQIAEEEEEPNYFDYYYYSDYEYDEYDDYDWNERENPCNATYYRQSDMILAKNVLSTDLALTLKKGPNGETFVAASNIVSAEPVENVQLQFFDFQRQLLASSYTGKDGMVKMLVEKRPYFLVGKKDKMMAYVRIDDGAALSLSQYDVSGVAVKKGIKGFIYGERGVWRPGDTLFLGFVLEDKENRLPPEHPVVFELYNAQNQLHCRFTQTKGINGMYVFKPVTDKNAVTGLWNAVVRVGGQKFQKNVRVETIMPNRLKIDLHTNKGDMLSASTDTRLYLHANWLTGAASPNLETKISVVLSPLTTEFKGYPNYIFDDATSSFNAQSAKVFDGKLDAAGSSTIVMDVKPDGVAPGMLRANFNTMVFEPGGAFSTDRYSCTYSPYKSYVGFQLPEGDKYNGILFTNRNHQVLVATVDENGKPVSRQNLQIQVYKLNWRWWWDSYENELANYASDNYHSPVFSETISTVNGKGKFNLRFENKDWGRYLIKVSDPASGHTASVVRYFDWENWMERGGDNNSKVFSNMLSFTSNKQSYNVGEEASITLPAPRKGRALITIENGTKVIEGHWFETDEGPSVFKFKISPEMAPNVYIHVSLLQPHERTNDLPIRSYGVIPIKIEDPKTHLQPLIQMASVLEPEKPVNITVSEKDGREMAFTIAVVEEGLLDITRFKTPDPHQNFYAKEALGIKTWDPYDRVIGAYGAELEKILSIGGDGSELDNDGNKANRFKPVVKYFGPYKLAKGEKRQINFTMPMYVGAVRTMVIAADAAAYGFAEKSSKVKAPLMLLGTLPRVLSTDEEVSLPVSVFGGDVAPGNTEITVQTNGILKLAGSNKQSLKIGKDDEKFLTFNLNVAHQVGIAKVKIVAKSAKYSATYDMELDVRHPNPYSTAVTDWQVAPNQTIAQAITGFGIPGTNSGKLEVSSLPAMNLEKRLKDLIEYPHGCVEQTTSKTFAQLYLKYLVDLKTDQLAEVEKNIKAGIRRLQDFQLSEGGMTYWQGGTGINDWGTNYAGHFLVLAEKEGYALPQGMLKKYISYQQNRARNFDISSAHYYNQDEIQAYRLYVLALSKNAELSAMNRLREYSKLSVLSAWYLAAAYAQLGQDAEAQALIAKAGQVSNTYRYNYYTFGSYERDLAIMLETYCLNSKQPDALRMLRKVAAAMSTNNWQSTQTMAYEMYSAALFAKTFGAGTAIQAQVAINGKQEVLNGKGISSVPLKFNGKSLDLQFKNTGKSNLFVSLINRGKAEIGDEQAAAAGIAVNVSYSDMNGNMISPGSIEQGENFVMRVSVKNAGNKFETRENIALVCPIPSGWEIHNARLDETEAALKNSAFTYQDIRDDRVMTYFDLRVQEEKNFSIVLNASYAGKFYLPAVNAEAMYDNTIYARTKGQWIQVVAKGKNAVAEK